MGVQITEITFRTLDEATDAASEVAASCPDPTLAAIGINELLVNAIEHGNLELTYADKSRLGNHQAWAEEIEHRLRDPRYSHRFARVTLERRATELVISVHDQGPGFDAGPYFEFDRDRLHHHHGRGIALARHLCFDDLTFHDGGRQAVAIISLGDRDAADHRARTTYADPAPVALAG